VGSCGLAACGSGQGPVAGCCEHGSRPLSFVKCGEFRNYLSDYKFLKKGTAPWSSLLITIKSGRNQ